MGSKPKNAVYLIDFSREKTALENPQIFQSCKYKNNNSAIHSQSERVGYFNMVSYSTMMLLPVISAGTGRPI